MQLRAGCRIRHVPDERITGKIVGQLPGQVAMGIDQAVAPSGGGVLTDQIAEQGRLTGPGLANNVEMAEPVTLSDAERLGTPSAIGEAECRDRNWRRSLAGHSRLAAVRERDSTRCRCFSNQAGRNVTSALLTMRPVTRLMVISREGPSLLRATVK